MIPKLFTAVDNVFSHECLLIVTGLAAWFYTSRGAPIGSQITSLAVLPLENLSADRTQEYLADGITDELITALARTNSVRVSCRRSVMQYKGVRKPLPQIARELGVTGVVEGSAVSSAIGYESPHN